MAHSPLTSHQSPLTTPQSSAAFSLIEVILVIALIALAASMIVANVSLLADRGAERSAEDQLRAAIHAARLEVARSRSLITLKFAPETGQIQLTQDGALNQSFDLGANFRYPEPGHLRFYLISSSQGMERFDDPRQSRTEQSSIDFSPDHSSTPFVAELDYGFGSPERLVFDPFSGLERKEPE